MLFISFALTQVSVMPLLITICLILLSFLPSIQASSIAAKSVEKPHLYADIAKNEDGQYHITRISTEKSRIDFITLKPLGFDQSKWDCSRMLFGFFTFSDHRECVPPESEFRTSSIRPLPTAILGVTTFGASLISGLIIEESVFDQGAYDKAVAEAIRNSGLEGKREELIKRFTALAELANSRNKELSELFGKYRDEYYNSTDQARIEKLIEDESGLYTNDLYPDIMIRVNRNALTELRPPAIPTVSITGDAAEFEEKLAYMESSLFDERTSLEDALRNATRDYPVFCGPEHLHPYHIKYDCPSRVAGGHETTARAIIVAKDISGALPEFFEVEDSSMKVLWQKDKLFIENRTTEKLNITGAALSYRGSSAKSFRPAEVAPSSKIDATVLYKLITPEIEKAATFANMTLKEAEKTSIGVSLTVTYEQQNIKKTLKSERVFKLSDLISKESMLKSRPAALH